MVPLLGVSDLSVVTDAVLAVLNRCMHAKYPTAGFNAIGNPPDTIRSDSNQLSLYLFHVAQDPFQRNSPVVTQQVPLPAPGGGTVNRAQTVPAQPLSLDLYYLLTAYSGHDYAWEQQAMSAALRCLHEHPFVRVTVTVGPESTVEEFILSMEPDTGDDLSRLWQAITQSLRLSVVYKVSVVFLMPPVARAPAQQVQIVRLAVNPTELLAAAGGQVSGTYRSYRYTAPGDLTPLQRTFDLSPATAGASETMLLLGSRLDQPTAAQVFLLDPSGEYDASGWTVQQTESRFTLQLPATVGPLPAPGSPLADTPPAGVYQLRVGAGAAPSAPNYYRSNTTPFNVAAFVDPTLPVILAPDGSGVFTVAGNGFIAGQTEVLLETIALTSGGVSAGAFDVPSATAIQFKPPASLSSGTYAVRIRVNTIECVPTKWIKI